MDRTKELAARARSLVQQWSPCRLGGAADGGLLAEGALARRAWDATHSEQATIEEAEDAYWFDYWCAPEGEAAIGLAALAEARPSGGAR